MTLNKNKRDEMSKLYIEKAHEAIRATKAIKAEFPSMAVSRSYYSMFYAAQSLLVLHGVEGLHRHEGVNNKFAELFVKTGEVSKDIFRTMGRMEQYRYKADYDPKAAFSKEDIEKHIHNAETFVETVQKIINKTLDKESTISEEKTETEKTEEKQQNSKKEILQLKAIQEKLQAQQAQGIISSARVEIPRGMDFNLPNADLNGVQESVVSSISDAEREVKDLQSDATAKEAEAGKMDKITAISTAKGIMGKNAIITSPRDGGIYHGDIIAKTDIYAIQRITDNQAILHEVKDLSDKTNVEVGAEITLHKHHDKTTPIKEDFQEQEQEIEDGRERATGRDGS